MFLVVRAIYCIGATVLSVHIKLILFVCNQYNICFYKHNHCIPSLLGIYTCSLLLKWSDCPTEKEINNERKKERREKLLSEVLPYGCPFIFGQVWVPHIEKEHHSIALPSMYHFMLKRIIKHNTLCGVRKREKHSACDVMCGKCGCVESEWVVVHACI